ncbi:DUF6173 family protein [Algirhabdus cladophorae]|uniref:DUF6173 family protein n=1 Tax=Algirhabdus cladophorae TaxID=3377108 RepID=UPI003B849A8C
MTDDIKTSAEALEAAAIPRKRDVGKDGKGQTADLPKALEEGIERKSAAQWAYERLILYIQKFEETLDSDQEAAMGFTGGDAGVLRIEGMGYFDPDMITFYGSDPAGGRTQLVQHVSQLNVMLRALPKHVDQAEPNRIGFRLAQELEETTG